jgi:hypothetical protein
VTKPKTLVQIERLQKLQEELGDVPFSEAIAKLQNPPRKPDGKGTWWDHSSRVNIFLCVEAIKKPGRGGTTRAWREVAKFYGLSVRVVGEAYVKGRKRFAAEPAWLRDEAVIFHRENAHPALKRFLQKSNRHQK